MDCPKCGYERQPEDTHCQLCGVDFELLDRQEAEKKALKEKARQKAEEETVQLAMEDKDDQADKPDQAFMDEYCPKCGYGRREGDEECPNCGAQLWAIHSCGAKVRYEDRFCQSCGEANPIYLGNDPDYFADKVE